MCFRNERFQFDELMPLSFLCRNYGSVKREHEYEFGCEMENLYAALVPQMHLNILSCLWMSEQGSC